MFKQPVIILGAPRSGTSLLHSIIREHDGFRSVAKESGFIWRPYTGPERHGWRAESYELSAINDATIGYIHAEFDKHALSARAWRRASGAGISRYQRSPLLAPILRAGYFGLTGAARLTRTMTGDRRTEDRLVDKSVHSALFLPLLDRVFPDALYLHITRNGDATLASMIDGWLNPDRFFSFDVPGGLAIPDYPYQQWNFALPPGWEAYRERPLADVAVFQWTSLQNRILTHFDDDRLASRLLRVQLESLSEDPQLELERIAKFLGLEWSHYFSGLVANLPAVNARPAARRTQDAERREDCLQRLSPESRARLNATQRALGYLT